VVARELELVGAACAQHGVALIVGGKGPWPEPAPHARLEREFAGLVRWMEELERALSGAGGKQRPT